MASNSPAPESVALLDGASGPDPLPTEPWVSAGPAAAAGEWNPSAETIRPVRGKHRVAKQRGGLARSSTVLGVGVIAAVGGAGMASAQERPAVSISLADLPGVSAVADSLPDAESLPGVGALLADSEDSTDAEAAPQGSADVTQALDTTTPLSVVNSAQQEGAAAGETLRARILQQAEQQQAAADAQAQADAEAKAAKAAADQAAEQQKEAAAAEAEKAAAEKKKAEEAAAEKAEKERLAKLARSYTLPVSSYTITSTFGQAGSMWSSGAHTGLDFAAAAGTPIKAVHSGTITQAGWSGSYGYHTVLKLDDGTEVTYSHQSSIGVSVGQKVSTGEVIGRVGSTGNSTGNHLHLEVHTSGGSNIDPLTWLRGKGLTV
ncbi:M23 family metallopeptidase [Streptomyces sp. NPDC060194]|uniref:M23 family metallopeptidase n=1 Tax=Streptomyces sp. NPDC060194 TaxID=3347069 RepID=UPI003662B0A9